MGCLVTNDISAVCDFLAGGVNQVFVTNRENLASFTVAGTAGRVDTIVLFSAKRWFSVDTSKGFTTYEEVAAKANGQKTVKQTVSIQTPDSSQETKNAYEELALSDDLLFVMRNAQGERKIFGLTNGLEGDEVKRVSGANAEDFAGFSGVFSGSNKGFALDLEDALAVDTTPFP